MKPVFEFKPIGSILKEGRLKVPTHQRNYLWQEEHVADLCKDFEENVFKTGEQGYFLGTIVLTSGENQGFIVVDGQQRLATVTIMLAVIRDIFHAKNDLDMVLSIEQDFIAKISRKVGGFVPQLQLNVKDNELFKTAILAKPSSDRKAAMDNLSTGRSSSLLLGARGYIRGFLENKIKAVNSPKDVLNAWVDFIEFKAMVTVLTVPSDRNAFKMFETLNDRGLKVSQADLIKNHLFKLTEESHQPQIQDLWASMIATLESVGEENDAIDYLRFLCSMLYGLTSGGKIFDRISDEVTSQHMALQFAHQIEKMAIDYAAILSPDHTKWNSYPVEIRRSLRTLASFEVSQVRHLMLAAACHFSKSETTKLFRMLVNWIIRLFVAGAGKVGRLEQKYATLAHQIHHGAIARTADAVFAELKSDLPSDEEFLTAFEMAKVSQQRLARYYLDSLERFKAEDKEADLVPNDDTSKVNLEHVIPRNWTQEKWPHLLPEEAADLYNRLGNLALLNAKKNSKIGDVSFTDKREAFQESGFNLTKMIATEEKWGRAEVENRQAKLAKLALKVWPLKR